MNSLGFYKTQIKTTEEFQRIQGLPRRVWTDAEAEHQAAEMTQALKTPKGTMRLRPIQAVALAEIGSYGGLFGPIPVGEGKTLISLLAPYVLSSRKPVLLLPAMLVAKTDRERIELSNHWRIPLNIRLMSIESLGRVSAANVLEAYAPDLIVVDEAHKLKNRKAAVTRRYNRYLAEHYDTKVVVMSGTMCKHSIEDYAHLAVHSLKENVPLPTEKGELMEWGEVLDERTAMSRVDPGALLDLCDAEELKRPRFTAARLGYQRRLLETPGVVSSKGADVACSLYINAVTYPVNQATEDNFKKLRATWTTPDDWALMQAVEVWNCARQLAAGLHYIWVPRPPQPWMEARGAWGKFVRDSLTRSRHLDSPLQVEMAVIAGELEDNGLLRAWKDIEKTFKVNSKPVWHDDSTLNFCMDWGKRPGIIWTDHSFFAHELARRSGWDYFGRQGLNAAGVPIDLRKASHEGQTIIASRKSNSTGRNLQYGWSRNLVVSPPGGADELEQMIARTHRPGQDADEVVVDLIFACAEHLKAWTDARAAAQMIQDTLGQKQKVLLASCDVDMAKMRRFTGARWLNTAHEKESGFVLPIL